ncbi:MAG: NAD(P)H-dependent oxidoreductase [Prevotella sp.]|jgi:putative NADPH-quinone reductase|nr:NAD(P)H-dependent oxidoreductase [Prevotella sp.]
MTTIIFAHPWQGSFNKSILDKVIKTLQNRGENYQLIDLNGDNFNPVMTSADLALYSQGKYADRLVGKYQKMLAESDGLVLIFPIWWGTAPAILKGFFDKVLLCGFAFSYENGWTPLLKINKATVITTSESPTDLFRLPIEQHFIPSMLESVGINNAVWLNCDQTAHGSDEHRQNFLQKVAESIANHG